MRKAVGGVWSNASAPMLGARRRAGSGQQGKKRRDIVHMDDALPAGRRLVGLGRGLGPHQEWLKRDTERRSARVGDMDEFCAPFGGAASSGLRRAKFETTHTTNTQA